MSEPQVVIVEGPDGAGKTTFVDNLRAWIDEPLTRVIHNGPPPKGGNLYRHYRAQLLDAIWFREARGVSTLIDRTFLSELIYGPIYRGKSRLSGRQVNKLIDLAVANDVKLIGVEANAFVRRARIELRGETWDPNQFMIGNLYAGAFRFHGAESPWLIVDTTSAPYTE